MNETARVTEWYNQINTINIAQTFLSELKQIAKGKYFTKTNKRHPALKLREYGLVDYHNSHNRRLQGLSNWFLTPQGHSILVKLDRLGNNSE